MIWWIYSIRGTVAPYFNMLNHALSVYDPSNMVCCPECVALLGIECGVIGIAGIAARMVQCMATRSDSGRLRYEGWYRNR